MYKWWRFQDEGYGSDIPIGIVIQDGEITWGKDTADTARDNVIGLTKDGKLKLMTNATANEALAAGVNDAMIFGPFLIVNGKPLEIVGDPWGQAPSSHWTNKRWNNPISSGRW